MSRFSCCNDLTLPCKRLWKFLSLCLLFDVAEYTSATKLKYYTICFYLTTRDGRGKLHKLHSFKAVMNLYSLINEREYGDLRLWKSVLGEALIWSHSDAKYWPCAFISFREFLLGVRKIAYINHFQVLSSYFDRNNFASIPQQCSSNPLYFLFVVKHKHIYFIMEQKLSLKAKTLN